MLPWGEIGLLLSGLVANDKYAEFFEFLGESEVGERQIFVNPSSVQINYGGGGATHVNTPAVPSPSFPNTHKIIFPLTQKQAMQIWVAS